GADAAFPAVVSKLFISSYFAFLNPFFGGENQASPGSKCKPFSIRVTKVFGDIMLKDFIMNFLHQVTFCQFINAGYINSHYNVSRAVSSFPFEALRETLFGKDYISVNTGFFFES